jgi:hypothetical protein
MSGLTLALMLASTATPGSMPDSARAAGFTESEWKSLAKGEVVNRVDTEKSPSGSTRARSRSGVLIHRPFEECFSEVERYEGLSKFLPNVAESRVLERGPGTFRAHAATKVLWLKYGYGLNFEVDKPAGEIRWTLDKSQPADIADTSGFWHFIPVDENTTLLHYVMRADSGSMLPQSIQNFATERSLPEFLVAFRDHLQSAKH